MAQAWKPPTRTSICWRAFSVDLVIAGSYLQNVRKIVSDKELLEVVADQG